MRTHTAPFTTTTNMEVTMSTTTINRIITGDTITIRGIDAARVVSIKRIPRRHLDLFALVIKAAGARHTRTLKVLADDEVQVHGLSGLDHMLAILAGEA